jgi:hypothetical protein
MLNRKILKLCLLVLLLPMLTILIPSQVNAAPPAITITPVQIETGGSNQDFCFGWTSSGLANTDNLIIGLKNDAADANLRFDVEGLTASEVTFYTGTSTCSGGTARATETGSTDDNGMDKISIINRATSWVFGQLYVGIILNFDSLDGTGNPLVIADAPISIKFANVAGNSVLTPPTSGNYKVFIEQYVDLSSPAEIDFMDEQLIYIGNLNQVNINATLDPSISLALSSTACDLTILDATKIQTCGYTATVTTNIGTGYTGYIEQNHPFQALVDGTTTAITGPTNSLIEAGAGLSGDYGEYGIGVLTEDNTTFPEFSAGVAGCTDYHNQSVTDLPATSLAADNTRYAFASYTAPVNGVSHGLTAFCSGVRIKYTTPPGQYNQLLTITVVGNF